MENFSSLDRFFHLTGSDYIVKVIISLFQVAVKLIKKSAIENKQDLVRIRREIRIMSALHHPNIIQIYEGS